MAPGHSGPHRVYLLGHRDAGRHCEARFPVVGAVDGIGSVGRGDNSVAYF